jgi:hypothetical protein
MPGENPRFSRALRSSIREGEGAILVDTPRLDWRLKEQYTGGAKCAPEDMQSQRSEQWFSTVLLMLFFEDSPREKS